MKKVKMFVFLVLSLCFTVFIASAEEANAADMHRLYNPNSGEHFYTANGNEKNHLVKVGWKYEGIGWIAPATGNAVYRLYNANAGDHHYTLNANEKNHLVKVGWKYEGIGWFSDVKKTIPLYRAYNPNAKAGSHNYTVNYAEQKNLIRVGWRDEGIAWYGIRKTTTPVTKYTVTVKHVGSDGKTLKTSTASVEKGKSYTGKAESFSGYTLNGSNSQTVTVNGYKTITFNYNKNKYSLTIFHKGDDGVLLETEKVMVEHGTDYKAYSKKYDGYVPTADYQPATNITSGNLSVTVYYRKNIVLSATEMQKMQNKIIQKVNELRKSLGLNELQLDSNLTAAANARAQELIILFSHTRPDGTSCFTALEEYHVVRSSAGENIALRGVSGTSGEALGEALYNQWYNSPDHYDNMVYPSYKYIGVGVSQSGTALYGIQFFIGRW